MRQPVHNRIRRLAGPVLLALLAVAGNALADQHTVRMAYVGETGTAAHDGARLGLDEANVQGKFLNFRFALDDIAPGDAGSLDASKYIAVLAAVPADRLRSLAQSYPGLPVLNLTAKDDALRRACIPNLFHIIQSHAMENDAVKQWRQKHPDSPVTATGWHPDFVKYAGRDLNKRFTAQFHQPMDEQAWAGWAGARMLADVIIRGTPDDAGKVEEYLKTRLAFDGQKGLDMTFRKTGQLRQPMLLTENGKLLHEEAPVRGVVDPDDYDSLGITNCAD